MKVIKTMRPSERGAKRFLERYGERLCTVRYRASDCGTTVYTTVEVIVDARPRSAEGVSSNYPNAVRQAEAVALKISYEETEQRRAIKHAGGKWSRQIQAWITRRDEAIKLGLAHRIEEGLVELCTDIDWSVEI
ncbi:hypothetical protein ACONUD_16980 [Microbulbifer harenosus]|uniref:Uncharacterized protein n=1 Tax=Microbulbifer harenosus TaxID=2576840 RepID=A0ABY2UDR9_9GAMM|nr:hypothetical protein [Microbulbifer harenosus]TLM74290.1 hypothetical protein FDY93_17665 [Microbulbifer harenosus]